MNYKQKERTDNMLFLEINRTIDPIVKLAGDWLAEINIFSIFLRLLLAIICSGIVGIERAAKRHEAGLRTYILVCMGSAIAMITNQFIFESFGAGDVSRFGAQVISGIGFLGAGTILVTSRNQIKGLTTAAGLWACACLGLSIGIGFYTLAIMGFMLIFIVMLFLPPIENFFTKYSSSSRLHLELQSRTDLKSFVAYAREHNMKIRSIERNAAYENSGLSVYTVSIVQLKLINRADEKARLSAVEEIKKLDYVNYVEEIY